MSTFGDREFGVTPVRGVRTFRVTSDGRLYGATGHEWAPGVNVSTCNAGLAFHHRGLRTNLAWKIQGRSLWPRDDEHDMATCSCGFYAYHDGVGDFAIDPGEGWLVHGVVEGSGKTTIGERGFRTERARLLALAPPTRPDPRSSGNEWVRVWVQRVFLVYVLAFALGFLTLDAVPWVPSVTAAYVESAADLVRANAGFVTVGLLLVDAVAKRRSGGRAGAFRREASAPAAPLDEETAAVVAALRERYPDVAVLPSLGELLTKHPPDRRPSA